MWKALQAVNNILSTAVALVVLLLLTAGIWFAAHWYREAQDRDAALERLTQEAAEKDLRITSLTQDVEAKRREIVKLQTALHLLKIDHRKAYIDVLKQQGDAAKGDLTTTFAFAELDKQGNPLGKPRVFTIHGDLLYVDTQVVKFADESVESGDPLRSASICLFRRLFGEMQKPKEGFSLDREGELPDVYRRHAEKPSEFEQAIWSQFWHYAANPEAAAKQGIRAAHGEAPSQKLLPGKRYRLDLRASGGLTFTVEGNAPPSPNATY